MKKTYFVFLITLLSFSTYSQSTFQNVYTGGGYDAAYAITEADGGGYLSVGHTESFGFSEFHFTATKLNADGDVEWSKQYGTNTDWEFEPHVLKVSGGYVITGTTGSFGAGSYDFCALKIDLVGDLIWQRTYGGSGYERAYGAALLSDSSMAITGQSASYSSGGDDFYIVRIDQNGDVLSSTSVGGTGNEHSWGVTESYDKGLLVSGTTWTYGAGGSDIYVVRLDSNATIEWTGVYGGTDSDVSYSIAATPDSGAVVSGYTSSYGSGSRNMFILKLDKDGNQDWSKTYSGSGWEFGYSVGVYDDGYIAAGRTNTFGGGNNDGYAVRTDLAGDTLWTRAYGGSGSDHFWLEGHTTTDGGYLTTGTSTTYGSGVVSEYLVKIDADGFSGCNDHFTDTEVATMTFLQTSGGSLTSGTTTNIPSFSTYTYTMVRDSLCHETGCFPTSGTDVQFACDSYTWIDGIEYTASNFSATDTLLNAEGCDSIVMLNLTIGMSSAATDVQVACDSYTWIDGITYFADNNTATYTLVNSEGCDSVVTLDLTINSVDPVITQTGSLLTANESGATYQWVRCPDMTTISGETDQSYTVTEDGGYAVIVTKDACSDTSDCVTIHGIGIDENGSGSFVLHPNPANEVVYVSGAGIDGEYQIMNSLGQKVLSGRLTSEIDVSHLDAGMYLFVSVIEGHRVIQRLMVE